MDLAATRRVPGVLGAWAASDLGDVPLVPAMLDPELARDRPWPAVATDRVRYAGEPVALVVAENRNLAEDRRDRARVSTEPLPTVLDAEQAAREEVRPVCRSARGRP
ncbi:hypothetical protein ACWCQN_47640 [Streptomyces sp. NPDC001984]|uniref:hypothetical protein n=1 Tax=Streptomyces sp. NPDC002619 TaxID=3364655 RepID=UPI0036AF891A